MRDFQSVKEVADFLKTQSVGTTCRLTGGGQVTKNVQNKFYRFGMRVKITGAHGNRTVELTQAYSDALKEQYLKPQRLYLKTDQAGDTDTYPSGLSVGQSAKVPGVNGRSLRQWVTSNYGPWTCTVRKDVGAQGWIVTRVSATPDPALFKTKKT